MAETYLSSSSPVFSVDGDVKGELASDLLRLEVESGEPRESHGLVSLGGRWEIGAFG